MMSVLYYHNTRIVILYWYNMMVVHIILYVRPYIVIPPYY